jgi:hypothetical protein
MGKGNIQDKGSMNAPGYGTERSWVHLKTLMRRVVFNKAEEVAEIKFYRVSRAILSI